MKNTPYNHKDFKPPPGLSEMSVSDAIDAYLDIEDEFRISTPGKRNTRSWKERATAQLHYMEHVATSLIGTGECAWDLIGARREERGTQ